MSKDEGNKDKSGSGGSSSGGSSGYRDPAVAYEHAKFGLKHFLPRVDGFWDEVNPEVWTVFDSVDVSVMEDELQELIQGLKGWDEKIVLSCSVLKEAETVLMHHQIDITHCRQTLKRCQRVILKARAQCKEQEAADKIQPTQSFKLDKVKLPTFSGNFVEWQDFADLFRAAVNDDPKIANPVKLKYLKDSLIGDAASIVATFPSMPNAYDEAWKLVEDRYDNPREIVFAHLRKLHHLKPVTDTSKGLRILCDTVNECTRALQMLELPVKHWDVILIFISHNKLEEKTKTEWLLTQGKELPVLKDFLGFLEKRANALTDPKFISKSRPSVTSSHHSSTDDQQKFTCPKCGDAHRLYLCEAFSKLPHGAKMKLVRAKKLCENCLNGGHGAEECRGKFRCKKCHQKHSSLLHKDEPNANSNASSSSSNQRADSNTGNRRSTGQSTSTDSPNEQQPNTSNNTEPPPVLSNHASSPQSQSVILLATLLVHVRDSSGQKNQCRVFYDPGSEAHFISESAVAQLGLRRQSSCVRVNGIGETDAGTATGIVSFEILSRYSNFVLPVSAHILPTLTGNLPRSRTRCQRDFAHLTGLTLADPDFHTPSRIDILLGGEATPQIILPGIRQGPRGTPLATNSRFGWFLIGPTPTSDSNPTSSFSVRVLHSTCSINSECLEVSLQKFWELEEPESQPQQSSHEDELVENHFLTTHIRESDGRFCVNLPFSSSDPQLGESRGKAIQCLKSLERQINKDASLKDSYHSQFQNFLKWKWIEPMPPLPAEVTSSYYMPHHVVTKLESTTTKYRIVFNASAKTSNGKSLNSVLFAGPKTQTDLHPLLIRFRCHPIAVSVDIVKFYQQVKVSLKDRDFQRLVYRSQTSDPIQDFRFSRVTFGVTSAPFLAIRCLKQLGHEHQQQFPLAHHAISHDFLVDNLLSGAESVREALDLKEQVTTVLAKGQFPLQKWASNHPEVFHQFPEEERESYSLDIHEDESIKTIGLFWHPSSDTFGVKITIPPESSSVTKRQILSFTARIFDPLSWLAPVTVSPRIILQSLWKLNLDWDDQIPPHLVTQWRKYCRDLELLKQFRINRCLTLQSPSSTTKLDVIGFCDASEHAYAACAYLRTISPEATKVELIAAKIKVAPVNGETIPRLELCSAVLLDKLLNFTATALLPSKLKINQILAFTDSTAALGQLFSNEKQDKFVSNRVRKIRNSAVPILWFHVPGKLNPADPSSRGISAKEFLAHPTWLHGPDFLTTGDFPPQPYPQCVLSSATQVDIDNGLSYVLDSISSLIQYNSSFTTMKRLMAYWIRFKEALKRKQPIIGPLTAKEIENAIVPLVMAVQSQAYSKEIRCCKSQSAVPTKIKFLSPFLDSNGILRVGGRTQQSELPWDQRHQMLLPKGHQKPDKSEEFRLGHLSRVIARYTHVTNLHPGPLLLLSLIRQKFWIPRGLNLCTRTVNTCIKCHKQNPVPVNQIMGQLPAPRVVPDFPFVKVGIDYAGPFTLAVTPGRNPRLIKAYVCVFICMAIKAIHLEFAGDLSTPSFIAAFQRFISIRNTPSDIYCDGGRNFLGADNEMKELQKLINDPTHQSKVANFFAGENIDYHYSPPDGPHHGGLWEAAVKSMKFHLARIIEGHRVSIEEFVTILSRTSAALNSRPLTPLSNNPDDFGALTPFHFLTLRPPRVPAEVDYTSLKGKTNRWQMVQQMSQHLFHRWSTEYLHTLQKKYKWLTSQKDLKPGILVLLHDVDSSLGPQRWQLGRVDTVHPGPDGRVRVVDVRLYVPQDEDKDKKFKKPKFRILRRPITRLSPLPLDEYLVNAHVSID